MTDDDLQIARWRCAQVYRIPDEVLDDFLHDAIVLALEKPEGQIEKFKMANWLALVAYRRFLDDKYRLRNRKTKQWPTYISKDGELREVEFESGDFDPEDTLLECESSEELTKKVIAMIDGLPTKLATTLHLRARVQGWHQVANSEGLTRQAIALRVKDIRQRIPRTP